MTGNSEILLIRTDGAIIAQQRDDKPGIANPGAVSSFGGGIEPGETPEQAAVREINEETNLGLTASSLTFWRQYRKTKAVHGVDLDIYYFIARDVSDHHLEIYEGQGYKVIPSLKASRQYRLSILFQQVLVDYFREFAPQAKISVTG
jgi:8-oxo-dGTP pyrophosphatase MutT (NUDIX family)